MSKKLFKEENSKNLSRNRYVIKISEKPMPMNSI
jgi:hypothetical protein